MGHYHTDNPENGKNYKRRECYWCKQRRYEKFMYQITIPPGSEWACVNCKLEYNRDVRKDNKNHKKQEHEKRTK